MDNLIFSCEAPDCSIQYYKIDMRFRMRKNGETKSFCLQCAPYMGESFGWDIKSREDLDRFKTTFGVDFNDSSMKPETDYHPYDEQTPMGKQDYDDSENRRLMREERERQKKEDILNGKKPVDETMLPRLSSKDPAQE